MIGNSEKNLKDPTGEYLKRCTSGSSAGNVLKHAVSSANIENADRPWVNSLLSRPLFVDSRQIRKLSDELSTLARAATADLLTHSSLASALRSLGVSDAEAQTAMAGSTGRVTEYMRADILFEKGQPRLIEFNSDCLGGTCMSKINTALMRNPVFKEFSDRHGLRYSDTRTELSRTLLEAMPAGSQVERPTVALVEERNSGLRAKFTAMDLAAIGAFTVVHCDINELEFRTDGVHHNGRRIDVILRYFTAGDTHPDDVETIRRCLKCHLNGQVGIVTSMDSEILSPKSLFSHLWQRSSQGSLSSDVSEIVRRLIPWTKANIPGTSSSRLNRGDYEYCMDCRVSLVFKPAQGMQSEGVIFGELTSTDKWRNLLQQQDSAFVVQDVVVADSERILDIDTSTTVDWKINFGCYLFGGRHSGIFVRGRPSHDPGPIGEPGPTRIGCAFEY